MRYLVISDLHGGADEVAKALEYFSLYKCNLIVLLGDLLNHGPKNKIPHSYEPMKVIELLNNYKNKIISVRGNCDNEADSSLFHFPCNAPYGLIHVEKNIVDEQGQIVCGGIQKIFLTHGHLHPIEVKKHKKAMSNACCSCDGDNEQDQEYCLEDEIALAEQLGLKANDIVLSGHTHIAGVFKKPNGIININPGSTTIPRANSEAGFGLILEDRIELRTLADNRLVATHNFVFS